MAAVPEVIFYHNYCRNILSFILINGSWEEGEMSCLIELDTSKSTTLRLKYTYMQQQS